MEPIAVPRLSEQSVRERGPPQTETKSLPIRLTAATLSTAVAAGLVLIFAWARNWLYSGAAILSQLLIYDQASHAPALPLTRPWMALASLNIVYAITSTSWLQYHVFTAVCWAAIFVTFVSVAPWASRLTRAIFRRLLTQVHLTHDVIAGFELPALHLDIGLEGLVTVRGWTFSVSTLTLELHGVEAAYNLTNLMHAAFFCDGIVIRVGRGIDIGAVYSFLKQETFAFNLGSPSRPEKGQVVAQRRIIGDIEARSVYNSVRQEISATNPIHQCRTQAESQTSPQLEEKTRAAMCEKMSNFTSVPHRPEQSIKASTIVEFIPAWIRRFFARTPLLLRLIMMPLSYLHPVKTASVSISASGSWMADNIRDQVDSTYDEDRDDIKQLEQAMTDWMKDATFCLDLSNIQSVVQVSIRASQDVVAHIRSESSTVMRIEPSSNKVAPAISVEGMDATFTVPPFFLPCHEHLLPPRSVSDIGDQADQEDHAEVKFGFHIKLPVVVDEKMINFFTDFINATIAMEMEDDSARPDEDLTSKSKIDRARIKVTTAAHDAGRSMKESMKKAAFNAQSDSWIPKTVNKIAGHLEELHGDVGYSGSFPVPLSPFRGAADSPTKWLA